MPMDLMVVSRLPRIVAPPQFMLVSPLLETLDYTIRIGTWQYTDLFIFRFIKVILDVC